MIQCLFYEPLNAAFLVYALARVEYALRGPLTFSSESESRSIGKYHEGTYMFGKRCSYLEYDPIGPILLLR
jgi:hypothetical protein